MTTMDRVMGYVEIIPPAACWFWMGAVTNKSAPFKNPCLKIGGRVQSVRRVVFEEEIGPLLDEPVRVVSGCGNDLCVRPEHICLTGPSDWGAAGRATGARRAAEKTHFDKCGHPRTPENMVRRRGNGTRCVTCERARKRAEKRAMAARPQPYRWIENKGRKRK